VRFVDVDDETRRALERLAEVEGGSATAEVTNRAGTRVKLHIEGLGSPMKARIKGGDDREVQVGSSLEFLKLGRSVSIEDVDHGVTTKGFVDGVKVEIDGATSVPQLVVALRFSEIARAVASQDEEAPKTRSVRSIASAEDANEEEGFSKEELGTSKLKETADKARVLSEQAVKKIGPAISNLGTGAKGLMGRISGLIKEKKEATAKKIAEKGPRRVTAPPPSGALKSEGKRVVREDSSSDDDAKETVAPKRGKKKMVAIAAVAALLIGGTATAAKFVGQSETKVPVAVESPKTPEKAALPPIPNAPMTADVPLFGATPLSTTEALAPQPAVGKVDSPPVEEGDEGDDKADADDAKLAREWGDGEVSHAKTIKVKMDGPVAGLRGEEIEGGFVIKVPGRKSTLSNPSLAGKDKRLAAFDVVNRDDGAEITVKFKGDVPAYLAKVKRDRVEIALTGEAKKTAQKDAKSGKKNAKKGTKKPATN
jgi:hypothetical protein